MHTALKSVENDIGDCYPPNKMATCIGDCYPPNKMTTCIGANYDECIILFFDISEEANLQGLYTNYPKLNIVNYLVDRINYSSPCKTLDRPRLKLVVMAHFML